MLATTLPSRTEIPNPYLKGDDGNLHYLKNGYGFTIDSGSATEVDMKSISTEYVATVWLTEQWQGISANTTEMISVVKSLHASAVEVQIALENNNLLQNVYAMQFQGTGSIEIQGEGHGRWAELALSYSISIREDL